jgi:hypothetical protein
LAAVKPFCGPFPDPGAERPEKLAQAIAEGRCRTMQVTMALPWHAFIWAFRGYWESCGKRGGVTTVQMETLIIEDQSP